MWSTSIYRDANAENSISKGHFSKTDSEILVMFRLTKRKFRKPEPLFLEKLVLWLFRPFTLNFEIELGRTDTLRMVVRQNLAKSGPQYRPVAFMI